MKLTHYLTLSEVLELHRLALARHGGASGVRDLGLIESSLYRPQSGYYETIFDQAGALLQSFCMNHPFVDGNKRVALLVTAAFLKINSIEIKTKNTEFADFILNQVIESKIEVVAIAAWLKKHSRPG
ncbi:MAG: type II toxin-antitoxin system death-on-curing family toxin [Bdellovibrionales bacterium]|nr:type II toxin-antitoxin system death-on-curing family toxin [Bdellovibrionales bacterium]